MKHVTRGASVQLSMKCRTSTRSERKGVHVSVHTIGGWALLVNAGLICLLLIESTVGVTGNTIGLLTAEALFPLFIVGLLGIWTALPHAGRFGRIGCIGLWCLGISAGIAFVVRLVAANGAGLILELLLSSSALLGLAGSLLVAWAMIHARAFHPALGWMLIVSSVLNLVGGVLGIAIVGILAALFQAAALGGLGLALLRSPAAERRESVMQ